jgi:hypothetical protein
MSLSVNLNKKLSEFTASKLMKCPKEAVFTYSQTEEIIRLDLLLNSIFVDALNELESKICEDKRIAVIMKEIEDLVVYDENNTLAMKEMKESSKLMKTDLDKLNCHIAEFEKNVSVNLLSQAEELNKVSKVNACQSVKISELKNEVDEIERKLSSFLVKESLEDIILRLKRVEMREIVDHRVDSLLTKFEDFVKASITNDMKQKEEIKCLNEKLNRNSVALDAKIDFLERQEVAIQKIDFSQNASIQFIQSEMEKMAKSIDVLQKAFLVKPVSC